MKEIDRRSVLTGIQCGAAVATVGLTVMPQTAKSLPLANIKAGAAKPQDLVEEARVTVHVHSRSRHRRGRATVHVHPRSRHRHHRHWRCWWHRGRRVCGWGW
jgi:hypothetical protein